MEQYRLKGQGAETVWNDINISASNLKGGVNQPDWEQVMGGIYSYTFDPAKDQDLSATTEILHDYKEGSTIQLHVHYAPLTNDVGNIVFGIEYCWLNINDSSPGTTTLYVTAPAGGVAYTHRAVTFPHISGAGKRIEGQIAMRIFRNGTHVDDTYPGKVCIPSFGIHYEIDSAGSRGVFQK